jgi:AbrB family looped-hinge helix DNA binding protein
MSARSVNKHRQILAAMFAYACRDDTHALAVNPVRGTSKRREMPAAVLDFYEPEETEALARAAAAGAHRGSPGYGIDADEFEWRGWEDRQDAELYRFAAYTGMRLGELLALRWGDVDLNARRVIVHRAVSANIEGPTKSWQARALPLADPAASALARLADRGDYTSRDDYVFCSRLGRRLDPSAVRRRYKRARDAAACDRCAFTRCDMQRARWSLARPAPTSSRRSSGTRGSARPSATCTRSRARRTWRSSTEHSPAPTGQRLYRPRNGDRRPAQTCENDDMTSVKKQTATLDQDGPLSIPTDIREAAHLKEGDTVLVEAANGGVVIRPIDADQAWFWTPEWQEREREADADRAAGRTLHFKSTEDFLAHLESIAPSSNGD